jgi:hypothetical protein
MANTWEAEGAAAAARGERVRVKVPPRARKEGAAAVAVGRLPWNSGLKGHTITILTQGGRHKWAVG